MYLPVFLSVWVWLHAYTCMYVMWVCMLVRMRVHVHLCISACMYGVQHTYVCMPDVLMVYNCVFWVSCDMTSSYYLRT